MKNLMLSASAWAQTRRQPREEGQTVIEYALVSAVVSIALIILMADFGKGLIDDAKSEAGQLHPDLEPARRRRRTSDCRRLRKASGDLT